MGNNRIQEKNEKSGMGNVLWKFFPWIWMLLGTAYDIWYQIVPGKWIVDSDLAAEMVLASHLNKTHRILSRDWFYSSELRVFESQWFYRIGLLFSPDNWHVARVIAAVLLYVVFIAVILFFAKSIGLQDFAPWMAAIMMWPFGRWYLVYALYGTYYIIYMLFALVTIGVLFRLNKSGRTDRRKAVLLYAVGFFCAFGSGLNGIKQTLIFFGPVFAAGLTVLFFAGVRSGAQNFRQLRECCQEEYRLALNTALLTVANLTGYFLNLKVLSKIYEFDSYNYMIFRDERQYRLYDVWMDFLWLFGYEGGAGVFSGVGIASIIGLGFAGIFVICLIRLLVRFGTVSAGNRLIVLLFCFAMLFDGVIYCLMGYYKIYYWLPLLPVAIAIILLELCTERFAMRNFGRWIVWGIALVLPLLSYAAVKQETAEPLFTTKGYPELVNFLEEEGLTEGYASFWSSEVLREMSSDRIKTWTLYNVSDNFVKYGWLQEKEKKKTDPEGRCFLIVNEVWDGRADKSVLVRYGTGELVYDSGPIKVYEFESPKKIQEAEEEFKKTFP